MSLKKNLDLFGKPLIGMIHLPSFSDLYGNSERVNDVIDLIMKDAHTLEKAGFNGLLIENFFDTPFPKNHLEEYKFLLMSFIVQRIISEVEIPCGINILRNCCTQALIMATLSRASFIRCNIWEGAYVTDQGIIEGAAYEVMRMKRKLDSQVKILADVHVKHAIPLGSYTIEEAAKNALFRGKADVIVLSGSETGQLISVNRLKQFVQGTGIKPFLGSGLSNENVKTVLPYISGAIVGTSIKERDISSPIDFGKAKALVSTWGGNL